MAKNLLDFKKEKVRCLIYTNKEGRVFVERNKENFKIIQEKYEQPTEVYNPNKEQEKLILDLLWQNVDLKKEKMEAKIESEDILLIVMEHLTNINLELDKEKDKELIDEILKDPSEELKLIQRELDGIVKSVFYDWYYAVKDVTDMPEELQDIYMKQINKQNKNVASDKYKEINELKQRLAELENKE